MGVGVEGPGNVKPMQQSVGCPDLYLLNLINVHCGDLCSAGEVSGCGGAENELVNEQHQHLLGEQLHHSKARLVCV